MRDEARFFGSIRFAAESVLEPVELADYVLRIEGRICGGLGQEGSHVAEEENVGLIEAYLVQMAQLVWDGVALGDVCDAHSDQLEGVYSALFDESDELKEDLRITGHWEGLLHLQWLEIDDRFRHSGVVTQAIERIVRNFSPGRSGHCLSERAGPHAGRMADARVP